MSPEDLKTLAAAREYIAVHAPLRDDTANILLARIDAAYNRASASPDLRKRVMTLGGYQRHSHGEFWISRDDVLRLLEESTP